MTCSGRRASEREREKMVLRSNWSKEERKNKEEDGACLRPPPGLRSSFECRAHCSTQVRRLCQRNRDQRQASCFDRAFQKRREHSFWFDRSSPAIFSPSLLQQQQQSLFTHALTLSLDGVLALYSTTSVLPMRRRVSRALAAMLFYFEKEGEEEEEEEKNENSLPLSFFLSPFEKKTAAAEAFLLLLFLLPLLLLLPPLAPLQNQQHTMRPRRATSSADTPPSRGSNHSRTRRGLAVAAAVAFAVAVAAVSAFVVVEVRFHFFFRREPFPLPPRPRPLSPLPFPPLFTKKETKQGRLIK